MLDTIYKQIIATIITVIFSIITSNFDRLNKYYKKRVNWFRPEFDIKPAESFDIITSSLEKGQPENASPEYIDDDETVIGDIEPVLIALRGRTINVQHYLPERFPKLRWDENIISFGGEVGNEFTKLILSRINCPLRYKRYKIVDSKDKTKYTPKWDKEGRIIIDYALIVKTPNPLSRELNKVVYIFSGIHKPGTLGAACFTQPKYAGMINEAVHGMKAFAVLAEIQADYLGSDRFDPKVTPKSIVRVYDLPYKFYGANFYKDNPLQIEWKEVPN